MTARPNPSRYYPLSADPEFRFAVRAWDRFTSETKGGLQTPQIMWRLTKGSDAAVRRLAERELSQELLRVFMAAVNWSLQTGAGGADDEIGLHMTPVILTTARLLNIPNKPAPVIQSQEVQRPSSFGEKSKTIKGRRLSEGVPPCWSPRWEAERERVRKYTPAQLFSGELLSFLMRILPVAQRALRAELKTGLEPARASEMVIRKLFLTEPVEVKQALRELEHAVDAAKRIDPRVSVREDALAALNALRKNKSKFEKASTVRLNQSLPAFLASFDARAAADELIAEREARELQYLAIVHKDSVNEAWGALRKRMPPKTPREQVDAIEGEFETAAQPDSFDLLAMGGEQ